MDYITTKITPIKSYPTYQLHAFAKGVKVGQDDAFKICILEVMRWIRKRLEALPDELNVPEPEKYNDFNLEELSSFELNTGSEIRSVYIPENKLWTFSITESDMGANMGTSAERTAVKGRTFTTDVSFCNKGTEIETGVRTICSEPISSEADCEVFRPTFIKMIAENTLIELKTVCPIDGRLMTADTKTATELLSENILDENNDLPFVLIAEPEFEQSDVPEKSVESDHIPTIEEFLSTRIDYKGFDNHCKFMDGIEIDFSKLKLDVKYPDDKREKNIINSGNKNSDEKKEVLPKEKPLVRLPSVDGERIAKKIVTLAFVVKVSEKQYAVLRNKAGITIKNGDVLVVWKGSTSEKYTTGDYIGGIKAFEDRLISDMKAFPKRRNYSYGSVKFCLEARLGEIRKSKSENITLEEKVELLQKENRQLLEMVRGYKQREADEKQSQEDIRTIQKKLDRSGEELQRMTEEKKALQAEFDKMTASYNEVSKVIAFYKNKVRLTAYAPNEKDKICSWIESAFADNIVLASRAKNEMKKYSGAMDTALLCDGIIYLNAYSLYRKGVLDAKELERYAADVGWEVCFSGMEAVRVYKSEYSARIGEKTYVLDQHIKYGVKSRNLIRVYFTWDEQLKKIVIGSMPEHLPTVKF